MEKKEKPPPKQMALGINYYLQVSLEQGQNRTISEERLKHEYCSLC